MLEEAGERGAVAPLVIERGIEEGIERVAGLGTEPGDGEVSPAAGAEQPGEEAERAAATGLARPVDELRLGCGIARFALGGALQSGAAAP